MIACIKCLRPRLLYAGLFIAAAAGTVSAQYVPAKGNDATTPLHLLKPDYSTPYGETTPQRVKEVLDKIYQYLEAVTPMQLINKPDGAIVGRLDDADFNSILKPGDFRLISYEWGVTYTGMLEAAAATGDKRYARYAVDRINFIGKVVQHYKALLKQHENGTVPVTSVIRPHALDDAGSMAAAMIKALRAGADEKVTRPMIDHFIDYILHKEFRLPDGTFARNRPLPNTLWLDDLYMSLPALAQMGLLSGQTSYFDEAVKQYRQFAARMFNETKGVYMHGWVQGMEPHPQFHWGRANGWALLTKTELLDALPATHPGRKEILSMFQKHVAGLAALQDKTGFWHQLLDRNDSYLETSATAIYTYCIARGINKGWLDARAYGPAALLAWNAVSTKVTSGGQIAGVCVGTGMGFDPAFYYYRPVNNFAAHGYGPVLLAGAEIFRMLQQHPFEINDSAVQMK
ncbi:glycoside hydrolase family 88 protein [Niabella sp. CC-SYL272]|uniref:glycoside hydrolase family 88/105 protein n=1 Tax=Niabella agricola TaxID=2891571 RepID=UPI001F35DB9B|nr:glycoside hydrolase family 88 protein [Niabella agricola]MCF3108155.1 glycoside hydrolase family 88 protein [Niabella agricola]